MTICFFSGAIEDISISAKSLQRQLEGVPFMVMVTIQTSEIKDGPKIKTSL